MGSLVPSSRFTGKGVAKHLPPEARFIVEYGPGTGNITKALLAHMPKEARLTAIELNARFLPLLRRIEDRRFRVIAGGVLESIAEIRRENPEGVDAIVSGIPFSLISSRERAQIVEQTRAALKTGGRFIAYQNSWALASVLRNYFPNVSTYIEPRNFPPYFIMVAEKD